MFKDLFFCICFGFVVAFIGGFLYIAVWPWWSSNYTEEGSGYHANCTDSFDAGLPACQDEVYAAAESYVNSPDYLDLLIEATLSEVSREAAARDVLAKFRSGYFRSDSPDIEYDLIMRGVRARENYSRNMRLLLKSNLDESNASFLAEVIMAKGHLYGCNSQVNWTLRVTKPKLSLSGIVVDRGQRQATFNVSDCPGHQLTS